jgi:hypothetical protein
MNAYRRRTICASLAAMFALSAISIAGFWRWPADRADPADTNLDADPDFEVTIGPDGGAGLSNYRITAPGTVFYHEPDGEAHRTGARVPTPMRRLAVRHDQELWSVYRALGLELDGELVPLRTPVGPGDPIRTDGPLAFSLIDAVVMRTINPRYVLPEMLWLPQQQIPPITWLQSGVEVSVEELRPGRARLVTTAENLDVMRIPRVVYVLMDGLLVGERRFVTERDVRAAMTESGDIELAELELREGASLVEIEAIRADHSRVRRSVRVRVGGLDTP